jgi:hypothetical protein
MKEDRPDYLKPISRIERVRMRKEFSIAGSEHRLGLFEIDLFEYYFEENEKRIAKLIDEENQQIQECNRLKAEYSDSGIIAVQYFEKRIRYSHIVYLTTLLEKCLKEACGRIKDTIGSQEVPFNWTELKGSTWEQCTKFLKEYAKVEVETKKQKKIRILHEIRNKIVHDGGEVDQNFCTKIAEVAGVDCRSSEIHVDGQYVRDMFEIVKSIAEKIDHSIGVIENRILKPELCIRES